MKTPLFSTVILATLALTLRAQDILPVNDPPADVYEVSDEVLVENPCRFGVNFEGRAALPWNSFRPNNLWNVMSAMEPYQSRFVHTLGKECRAEGAKIYDPLVKPAHGGLSFWDSVPFGVYDGGNLAYYRVKDGVLEKIHEAKVVSLFPDPATGFIEMEPALPVAPEAGDIVVIDKAFLNFPVEAQSAAANPKRAEFRKKFGFSGFEPTSKDVVASFDDGQKCPEGGSTASLKMVLPGGKPAGFKQWFSYLSTKPFTMILPEGAKFRGQVWMRQEGMGSGEVTIVCGGQYRGNFTVTGDWKNFEWEFAIDPSKMPPEGKGPDSIEIKSAEAGTLWVDNFAIWDTAEPLNAVRKIHSDRMKEARLGSLRIWTPLHRSSLEDAIFGTVFTAKTDFSQKSGAQSFDGLSVHDQLVLAKETGADPWLNLHPLAGDRELKNLMDYLAGDASTEWGRRRAEMGQTEPWTKVFKHIYLECGNETWNTIFAPLAWPGRPDIYGGVANRMFKHIKSHPLYNKDQFVCVASGFGCQPAEWTKRVIESATEADMVDVAAYFGGSDGLSAKSSGETVDDESKARAIIRGQLVMSGPGIVGRDRLKLLDVVAAHEEKTGRRIALGDYESGPGYILPDPGQPFRPRDEIIGKSLGLGVVTLDSFLMEASHGYKAVNYFKWDIGANWVTHNNERDMTPHASWIAVMMRNKYCDGSMMKVSSPERKLVDVPPQELEGWTYDGKPRDVKYPGQKDVPLTECYAFRDGRRHALVFFSRTTDETRKIRVRLPYDPQPAADLHYLTGNYWDGNFEEHKIQEQHKRITDFSKDYTFDLPPNSIYLFVNEEK